MVKCHSEFTYSIDKPECQREQNLNELGNRTPQNVSFTDQTCVTKTIDANDPGFTFYSLSLKLTNKNIIVTGPERITFDCRVKNVHEINLPRWCFRIKHMICYISYAAYNIAYAVCLIETSKKLYPTRSTSHRLYAIAMYLFFWQWRPWCRNAYPRQINVSWFLPFWITVGITVQYSGHCYWWLYGELIPRDGKIYW